MFNTAYRPYYQNSRNEYISPGGAGMGAWTHKADQVERLLSAQQIQRLSAKQNHSQKTTIALESGQKEDKGDNMFDTRVIGQRIAVLRKAKDMTQMELADKMLVSYQAVSNWERGNSMPDISKLADLAEILGVSMEELLGSKRETEIIEKVSQSQAPVTMEEVAQVAPALKPSMLDELVERSGDGKVDLRTLTELAPYFSEERLERWAEDIKVDSLRELAGLAPFMSSAALGKLIAKQDGLSGDLNQVTALAPFLDSADLGRMVNEHLEGGAAFSQVVALAPFMDDRDLDALAERISDEGLNGSQLVALAPFLSSETLGKLVNKHMQAGGDFGQVLALAPFLDDEVIDQLATRLAGSDMSGAQLASLAPFIESKTLSKLLKDVPAEGLQAQVKALAPFMESEDLLPYARQALEAGDLKAFKSLLPFIDTDQL